MIKNYDVIIVGGGIVGLATALKILEKDTNLKMAILEKETQLAYHQTGHNSGVIHAGVYYKPGSLKADFCRKGCQATKAFCNIHNIPYQVPGKLIVATNEKESLWLDDLMINCQKNNLSPIKLTAQEVLQYQPGLKTVGGMFVNETGIVNWALVCQKYAELLTQQNVDIFYGQAVIGIQETLQSVQVITQQQQLECGYLITCAGLHADKLVQLSGQQSPIKIIPFRGEYYQLSDRYKNYFNHLIYPVPNPAMPFLGVHFTPQISGITTVGPNAILALSREGYHWGAIKLTEMMEILTYPAIWKMIRKNYRSIFKELCSSISKKHYLRLLQCYFPAIQMRDLQYYPAGVRAQAMYSDGRLAEDFLFSESKRILHTCHAPSPAATANLPIGHYIAEKFYQLVEH